MKDLVLSESFKDNLRNIERDSKVAKYLLSDYFNSSESFNYVTLRSNGLIAYCPSGKDQEFNSNGTWINHSYRQTGKPSKVARKLLNKRALRFLKEKDFELFTNKIKSANEAVFTKVSRYSDLNRIYDTDYQAEDGTGTLGSSCMRNEFDYLEIYKSVGVEGVALHNDNGEIIARALLWPKVYEIEEEPVTLMDRVYGSDVSIEVLLSYARKQGWYHKEHQNYSDNREFIKPNGDSVCSLASVKGAAEADYYPYVDTLKYFDTSDGTMSNYETSQCLILEETDGGPNRGVWCEDSQRNVDEDDAFYIERYGEYYEEANWSDYDQEYIPDIDSVWSNIEDSYLWYSKVVELHNGDIASESNDDVICLPDGDYALIDDCFCCEQSDIYYLHGDNAVDVDGALVHVDNVEQYKKENEITEEVTA